MNDKQIYGMMKNVESLVQINWTAVQHALFATNHDALQQVATACPDMPRSIEIIVAQMVDAGQSIRSYDAATRWVSYLDLLERTLAKEVGIKVANNIVDTVSTTLDRVTHQAIAMETFAFASKNGGRKWVDLSCEEAS